MTTPVITRQTRIGVICGGLSSEREVSLRSGNNCLAALHRLGYEQAILIDADDQLPARLSKARIELAFLALHGKYGEDGAVQGLLEWMHIPYTGNSLEASAVTMNKALTKLVLREVGLPVLPELCMRVADIPPEGPALPFPYPVILKPLNEGSSVGMAKFNTPAQWQEAGWRQALRPDTEVMIEPFATGPALTVGVFDREPRQPVVTPILEFRIVAGHTSDWYDLEAKYTKGLTEFILPAALDADTTKAIQDVTLAAHHALGCRGLSRTDYVMDAARRHFWILEVNSIPGMTDLSDLPAQAQAMGVDYDTLVNCILHSATLHLAPLRPAEVSARA